MLDKGAFPMGLELHIGFGVVSLRFEKFFAGHGYLKFFIIFKPKEGGSDFVTPFNTQKMNLVAFRW